MLRFTLQQQCLRLSQSSFSIADVNACQQLSLIHPGARFRCQGNDRAFRLGGHLNLTPGCRHAHQMQHLCNRICAQSLYLDGGRRQRPARNRGRVLHGPRWLGIPEKARPDPEGHDEHQHERHHDGFFHPFTPLSPDIARHMNPTVAWIIASAPRGQGRGTLTLILMRQPEPMLNHWITGPGNGR